MTEAAIGSWSDLTLADLLLAFRKAKAECFFERSTYAAEAFTSYEDNIFSNLSRLHANLINGFIDDVLTLGIGRPQIFGKRLALERHAQSNGHSFFSDSERAFEHISQNCDVIPEFRLVGDFTVDMHVLSALWINTVGHKYDSRLRRNAYGSRVRRYGSDRSPEDRPSGDYQLDALGIFDPYFRPYRTWRDDGIKAIKASLEDEKPIVAITLDFSSYYHNIDPLFMTNKRFLDKIGLFLNSWEISFTQSLVDALSKWGAKAATMIGEPEESSEPVGGLPIGLSAVRIITNVLLYDLDEAIVKSLSPIYYGRYVDDIFLVIGDPGNITDSQSLWTHISNIAHVFQPDHVTGDTRISLDPEYQGKTKLTLQPAKQKIFFLKGRSGLDLLDNIAHQIRSLSSERRLMPIAGELDATGSARALAAADNPSQEADSLRRADGLTLRRLGWALQLRSVEILARDLERRSWTAERRRFYEFARAHILRPDKILEQIDYLPRLISLAVSLSDWSDATRLYKAAIRSLDRIEGRVGSGRCRVNGRDLGTTPNSIWMAIRSWVERSCKDALLRSIPWDKSTGHPKKLTRDALRMLDEMGLGKAEDLVLEIAFSMREKDWAKVPYKEHVRRDAYRERVRDDGDAYLEEAFRYSETLRDFLENSRSAHQVAGARRLNARCDLGGDAGNEPSLLPYIFATRPYSAQEVALYLPEQCVFGDPDLASDNWGHYVRAVRGVWPHIDRNADEREMPSVEPADDRDPPMAVITGGQRRELLLGISSLETSDACWSAGASGAIDLSPERYARLATIVNLAVKAVPRPTHLLLPELSLPEAWLLTISAVLQEADISLIAGLDYDHFSATEVSSSAVMVLSDDRLGYPSSVQIRQPKLAPAPGEEDNLHIIHGKDWRKWDKTTHPIYVHNGFHFGVLVCSELQNIDHRRRYQGQVDWLAVLSWNPDLETFSALVESASLDVHAYVALVNNRSYGDSRVRAPRKEAFARDVCRIRGGLNDHLVVVKIEPSLLRAQQSRARRSPRPSDYYKPAPEGFRISQGRRTIPK